MDEPRPKEKVARGATAGPATEPGNGANQFDLFDPPLSPVAHKAAAERSTMFRGAGSDASVPDVRKIDGGSSMNAPERKPLQRRRINTPVKVVALKRALAAARKMGLDVNAIDMRPCSTIVLSTSQVTAASANPKDVFEQWADRL